MYYTETIFYDEEKTNINSITTFSNGVKNGLYTSFHKNGNIWIKCIYLNNKLDGLYTKYNENGYKEIECEYKQNVLHGSFTSYDYKLKLKYVCNYEYGKLHGNSIIYYLIPNLDDIYPILVIMNYKNGIIDGFYKEFTTKGICIKDAFYNDGKLDGIYEEYDKNSQIILYRFYENNQITREINYKQNENNKSFTKVLLDKINSFI